MKKQLPIIIALLFVLGATWFVVNQKGKSTSTASLKTVAKQSISLTTFNKTASCAKPPAFLHQLHIPQPVVIDLSQKHYTGLSLRYGKQFQKLLHPKQWESYGNLGTYSVDEKGNIFLAPIPYISIKEKTFTWQSNIYMLESQSGQLTLWKHLDTVKPSASNPYGITALVYDCSNHTLWISTIDKSDYQNEKGVLYHIDVKTKKVLQKVSGKDILSLQILTTHKEKILLAGSARDNRLYGYSILQNGSINPTPKILLELPIDNAHIRKIKVIKENTLELQSIPFSYTLITQTAQSDRIYYHALWQPKVQKWNTFPLK